ncbi:MAG: flagellar FlbD family protein [Eubacteriales bacterium]
MIRVTRMNGLEFVVNAELIEFVESTPDTVLTLTTGKKFVLKDSLQDVVDKIIAYRKDIGTKIIYQSAPANEQSLERCDE